MTIKTDTDYHAAIHGLLKFVSDSSHPYNLPLTAESQATFIAAIFHQAGEILDSDQFARGEIIRSMQKQKELDFADLEKANENLLNELGDLEDVVEFNDYLLDEMDIYEELEDRVADLKSKDTKGAAKILKELRERQEHRMSSRAANEECDNCDRGGDCCREILE